MAYTEPAKGLNPALDKWSAAGLRTVTLPSGTEVRIKLIPVEHLIKRGLVPTELTAVAMKFSLEGVSTAGMDRESFTAFLGLVDVLVCQMLRDIKIGDEWTPITLTPALLDELDLPADDMEALGFIAIRKATPEMVTLESRVTLGLVEAAEAATERREAEEAAVSTSDLASFRSDGSLPPPGEDGADVREEAVGTGGDRRPGRRARLRSSGVHPTK